MQVRSGNSSNIPGKRPQLLRTGLYKIISIIIGSDYAFATEDDGFAIATEDGLFAIYGTYVDGLMSYVFGTEDGLYAIATEDELYTIAS